MYIKLKVTFSRAPLEGEISQLWDEFFLTVEEMQLYAGGSSLSDKLSWYIDTSYTTLSTGEIIDRLMTFLAEKASLISQFKIKATYKMGEMLPGKNPKPYLPGCSL